MIFKYASIQAKYRYLLLWLLLMVAFVLRFEHLLARVFHIDEYISMLAALMTAQKGAPILPSGLLYHQGLLVSYLTAPFIRFLGFSEEIARWPSLLVGMVTVASLFSIGRRLFKSQAAGLFALTFAVLDATMILWSARMRMYALAGLFMLLALYFLALGTFLNPSRRHRLAAAVFYLGATLTHSVSVVILPVWGLATIFCVALGHKRFGLTWYRQRSITLEILITLLILVLGVGFGIFGQIPFLSPEAANTGGADSGILGVFEKFLDPGVSWQRVDDFIYYFTSAVYWPLAMLGGLSFLAALVAVARRKFTRRDLAALFLGMVLLLTILELGLALTHTWRKTRYLFILCQAPFLLLAADGLARVGQVLSILARNRARTLTPVATLVGIVAITGFWAGPAIDVASSQSTGGYDTAFVWAGEHWQETDRVMTVHPSASFLYLGRSDYYATQKTARTLLDEEADEPVDRYVGSMLVDSVDTLNQVLTEQGRRWFVVDTNRLFSRYEPYFTQQVFAQMDVVHQAGEVLVFLSRPYPQPVPMEPAAIVNANFSDLIELGGYSLDLGAIKPDGSLQLGLYWRPLAGQLTRPYKVFVQLRDDQGQIVAQADHYIFEGFLTGSILGQLREQGEWLRDTADLALPEALPSGTYRLLVGLYDPDTFERVPVVADQSGENAVILETVSIP